MPVLRELAFAESQRRIKYTRVHQVYCKDNIYKQYIKHHGRQRRAGNRSELAAGLWFWVCLRKQTLLGAPSSGIAHQELGSLTRLISPASSLLNYKFLGTRSAPAGPAFPPHAEQCQQKGSCDISALHQLRAGSSPPGENTYCAPARAIVPRSAGTHCPFCFRTRQS